MKGKKMETPVVKKKKIGRPRKNPISSSYSKPLEMVMAKLAPAVAPAVAPPVKRKWTRRSKGAVRASLKSAKEAVDALKEQSSSMEYQLKRQAEHMYAYGVERSDLIEIIAAHHQLASVQEVMTRLLLKAHNITVSRDAVSREILSQREVNEVSLR